MKHVVNDPCQVCGASASRLLHSLAWPEFGYPGEFAIRECSGCGLLFNSPRLGGERLAELYGAGYYVFQERERDAFERIAQLARQTLAVAEPSCPAREVLEVGSAKGYMLALLRTRGWRVQGVELSAAACRHARRRFGLAVHCGTLESWRQSPAFRPFPVLLTTDVVEHVPDPDAFVRDLFASLTPGGLLVVGTPNADSDHRQRHAANWLGFNPFHIYLFSRATLGRLLERQGFVIERAYTYANGDPQPAAARSATRRLLRGALDATGLLPAARASRTLLSGLTERPAFALAANLRHAQALFETAPGYLQTEDGRSPRRDHCRGDNLVIFARRPQETKA